MLFHKLVHLWKDAGIHYVSEFVKKLFKKERQLKRNNEKMIM